MKKVKKTKQKTMLKLKKTEKLKEIIRRETGIYIKRMNSRNLKKEFEQFYYIMASNYPYSYRTPEDIKPFIEGLNKLFGELAEDEDFIYVSTHLENDEEITEE